MFKDELGDQSFSSHEGVCSGKDVAVERQGADGWPDEHEKDPDPRADIDVLATSFQIAATERFIRLHSTG